MSLQEEDPAFHCSICLGDRDGIRDKTITTCGHTFCTSCLIVALMYDESCPICRHHLIDAYIEVEADEEEKDEDEDEDEEDEDEDEDEEEEEEEEDEEVEDEVVEEDDAIPDDDDPLVSDEDEISLIQNDAHDVHEMPKPCDEKSTVEQITWLLTAKGFTMLDLVAIMTQRPSLSNDALNLFNLEKKRLEICDMIALLDRLPA